MSEPSQFEKEFVSYNPSAPLTERFSFYSGYIVGFLQRSGVTPVATKAMLRTFLEVREELYKHEDRMEIPKPKGQDDTPEPG